MSHHRLIKAVLAFMLALPLALNGYAHAENHPDKVSLLNYQHKSLKNGKATTLQSYQDKPIAMVFFEPECSWCLKQMKVLKSLHKQCDQSFTPMALGVNGDRIQFKRTLFKMKFPFPAFQGSPKLVQDLGGIPATPIMLITDNNGDYAKSFRGLTKAKQLKPYLCAF